MNVTIDGAFLQGVAAVVGALALLGSTFIVPMLALKQSRRNRDEIKTMGAQMGTLEKNTNSISERNEAIAKKLGVHEGQAQERAERAERDSHAAPAAPAVPLAVEVVGPITMKPEQDKK